jgi:hypothetical protein
MFAAETAFGRVIIDLVMCFEVFLRRPGLKARKIEVPALLRIFQRIGASFLPSLP